MQDTDSELVRWEAAAIKRLGTVEKQTAEKKTERIQAACIKLQAFVKDAMKIILKPVPEGSQELEVERADRLAREVSRLSIVAQHFVGGSMGVEDIARAAAALEAEVKEEAVVDLKNIIQTVRETALLIEEEVRPMRISMVKMDKQGDAFTMMARNQMKNSKAKFVVLADPDGLEHTHVFAGVTEHIDMVAHLLEKHKGWTFVGAGFVGKSENYYGDDDDFEALPIESEERPFVWKARFNSNSCRSDAADALTGKRDSPTREEYRRIILTKIQEEAGQLSEVA